MVKAQTLILPKRVFELEENRARFEEFIKQKIN